MKNEIQIGIILKYASIALSMITSILLTPYVINTLGVEEYGIFLLSNTIISWIALTDMGLGATIGKYIVTYQAKKEYNQQAHFLGQCIILHCAVALIALLIGGLCITKMETFFPLLDKNQLDLLKILFSITLANLVVSIPLRPISCIPNAYQKFIIPSAAGLITSLLNTIFTIVLLYNGYRAVALTLVSVITGGLAILYSIWYSIMSLNVKIVFKRPDWVLYKGMFSFSVWIFMNQIMDLLYWRAGGSVLASTCGASAISVYTLGISFSVYFITAANGISGVLVPKFMHMVAASATKEELTIAMIRAGRLQLSILLILCMGFLFFGRQFLTLWVGDSYGESINVIWTGALIVLIPLLVPMTQNTGVSILQALHIHKGRAIILLYTAIICVSIGAVLSIFTGPIGMYLGTSASLIIGQIVMMNIYYKRKAKLLMGMFYRKTYLPAILPTIILILLGGMFVYFTSISTWNDFIITASIYGGISLAVLYASYLNKSEKKSLFKIFRK